METFLVESQVQTKSGCRILDFLLTAKKIAALNFVLRQMVQIHKLCCYALNTFGNGMKMTRLVYCKL